MTDKVQPHADDPTSDGGSPPETISSKINDKFINTPDDARGYIALSIFMLELLDRHHDVATEKIWEEVTALSDRTISITYKAAANRILDIYSQDETEKQMDEDLRNNHLFLRIIGRFEEKHKEMINQFEYRFQEMEDDLKEYSQTQTLMRQTVASAFGTAILTALALIIVFGPDLLGTLRKVLHLGG